MEREKRRTPTLLGPLDTASLHHWKKLVSQTTMLILFILATVVFSAKYGGTFPLSLL
jgi:hypothetical protein